MSKTLVFGLVIQTRAVEMDDDTKETLNLEEHFNEMEVGLDWGRKEKIADTLYAAIAHINRHRADEANEYVAKFLKDAGKLEKAFKLMDEAESGQA